MVGVVIYSPVRWRSCCDVHSTQRWLTEHTRCCNNFALYILRSWQVGVYKAEKKTLLKSSPGWTDRSDTHTHTHSELAVSKRAHTLIVVCRQLALKCRVSCIVELNDIVVVLGEWSCRNSGFVRSFVIACMLGSVASKLKFDIGSRSVFYSRGNFAYLKWRE